MDILKRRHAESESPWVFRSAKGTLRDPDNTRKYIRQVVLIGVYVGHDGPSTAQDVYMERGVVGQQAGLTLEAWSSGRLQDHGETMDSSGGDEGENPWPLS